MQSSIPRLRERKPKAQPVTDDFARKAEKSCHVAPNCIPCAKQGTR